MTEAFRDYTSLGLIVTESVEERDRILAYIRKNLSKDKIWERYYDPESLGYARVEVLETDSLFIQFRSSNSGVYKPSHVTEALKNSVAGYLANLVTLEKLVRDTITLADTPGMKLNWDIALKTIPLLTDAFNKVSFLKDVKRLTLREVLNRTLERKTELEKIEIETLQEKLNKTGFKFKLLEAISKWDDKHEKWEMITDTRSVTIDISEIEKSITPVGYLSIDDVFEYYELNVLADIQDELDVPVGNMSKEEKINAILDCNAFNESTGYYEWTEEEINLAIFKILKNEA